MEKIFTPLELFALALAAQTMAELYRQRNVPEVSQKTMDAVAAKMKKYLEPYC